MNKSILAILGGITFLNTIVVLPTMGQTTDVEKFKVVCIALVNNELELIIDLNTCKAVTSLENLTDKKNADDNFVVCDAKVNEEYLDIDMLSCLELEDFVTLELEKKHSRTPYRLSNYYGNYVIHNNTTWLLTTGTVSYKKDTDSINVPNPEITNYGFIPKVTNYGAIPQVNTFGTTSEITNYGAVPQVNTFGTTSEITNYGAVPQVNTFETTSEITNYGAVPQVNTFGHIPEINTPYYQGGDTYILPYPIKMD